MYTMENFRTNKKPIIILAVAFLFIFALQPLKREYDKNMALQELFVTDVDAIVSSYGDNILDYKMQDSVIELYIKSPKLQSELYDKVSNSARIYNRKEITLNIYAADNTILESYNI